MMDWLTTWSLWHWLILGFALLIGEVLTPGVFLMWWGFSALITALLQWLFPALPLSVFAIFLCCFSLYSFRDLVEISEWERSPSTITF